LMNLAAYSFPVPFCRHFRTMANWPLPGGREEGTRGEGREGELGSPQCLPNYFPTVRGSGNPMTLQKNWKFLALNTSLSPILQGYPQGTKRNWDDVDKSRSGSLSGTERRSEDLLH
jgi:hypothetical protein